MSTWAAVLSLSQFLGAFLPTPTQGLKTSSKLIPYGSIQRKCGPNFSSYHLVVIQ